MQIRFLMPLLLGLFVLGAGTGIVQAEDRAAVASDARSSETTGAEPDYDAMTSSMMDALALDPGIACRGPGIILKTAVDRSIPLRTSHER